MLRAFSFREKLFVGVAFFGILLGSGYWLTSLYRHFTVELPDYGGSYQEGLVGQPNSINPLLSSGNPADADLVRLLFSGLLKYDREGKIVNDLAEDFKVSDDGREYTVFLKRNLVWHDGEVLTIDDVVFTYEILQNPVYRSPLRQKMPAGVKVEKVDEGSLKFTLAEPSLGFADNLTVGILPKHIWEQVNPDRFNLSTNNLTPIGSGPYRFGSLQKSPEGDILSITLKSFSKYHAGMPYIKEFSMYYYSSSEAMIAGYARKEVKGMHELSDVTEKTLGDSAKTTTAHKLFAPQYYVVFFNQTKSKALAYDEVRKALVLAIDRSTLIRDASHGEGIAVQAPFLPGDGAYRDDALQKAPNVAEAEQSLESAGWTKGDDGVRVKGGLRLEFSLTTADWGNLSLSTEVLKRQWEAIGARVNVSVLDTYDLSQNHIRPKEYEALLYVQAPGPNPNLFSYWHSSQKDGDGLNLSLFSNKDLDSLLEKTKVTVNQDELNEQYRAFQDILLQKNPAAYLYAPINFYPVSNKVFGIEDGKVNDYSDRLWEVGKWYVETKRKFK